MPFFEKKETKDGVENIKRKKHISFGGNYAKNKEKNNNCLACF